MSYRSGNAFVALSQHEGRPSPASKGVQVFRDRRGRASPSSTTSTKDSLRDLADHHIDGGDVRAADLDAGPTGQFTPVGESRSIKLCPDPNDFLYNVTPSQLSSVLFPGISFCPGFTEESLSSQSFPSVDVYPSRSASIPRWNTRLPSSTGGTVAGVSR